MKTIEQPQNIKIYKESNIVFYVKFKNGLSVKIGDEKCQISVCGNKDFSQLEEVSFNSLQNKIKQEVIEIVKLNQSVTNGSNKQLINRRNCSRHHSLNFVGL